MKIFKYYNWNIPGCVNLWRGFYKKGTEEIGFGTDDTFPDNNAIELSEIDFYAYVNSMGESVPDAEALFNKLTSIAAQDFLGQKPTTKEGVMRLVDEKINQIFADPDGKLTSDQYKESLMAQIVSILCASNGHITYEQTGVQGVVDSATASAFIMAFLPKWQEVAQVMASADQFVINNNLG